jgi:hypothetical protein
MSVDVDLSLRDAAENWQTKALRNVLSQSIMLSLMKLFVRVSVNVLPQKEKGGRVP